MSDFGSQIKIIGAGIAMIVAIILVLSVITYLYSTLQSKELSDQTGWKNFGGPAIGCTIVTMTILGIIAAILILLGVIH